MAEQQYQESNYRFTDPIRFFKANDPYYFEVDNIPLKQLQENCLWLKDQVRKDTNKLLGVKRSDIDELRPYATGGDRLVRVKPGRYTSRINDASTREPLAYLRKVMGAAVGDVDAWAAATPNPGTFPGGKNAILGAALDKFKETTAENALGMNGLVERAFTWPVVTSDTPIDNDGADLDTTKSWLSFGGEDVNTPGGGAGISPFPITEAIAWAKSQGSTVSEVVLPSFEITNMNSGWAKFPLTESYFIKAWRGVSRLAIVDIDDEITVEVPQFDSTDFSYTGEDGQSVDVTGVSQRIDLVFIYSKPVDTSSVDTIQNGAVERITKPTLGIVKGAGIKASFEGKSTDLAAGYKVDANDSILASPGDQSNTGMGFNSTSANDIAYPIRGSFPAPDDLLNLAPLISEKLEDNAYELVGQSILPVAYVFVQDGSQIVLSTDVVDIRPLFRTAELTYNERAGIGAAFPQLSLANPAVGKGQLDYELKRMYNDVNSRINILENESNFLESISTLATGYVFGGWNFGPEGALFDYYQGVFAADNDPDDVTTLTNDATAYIKSYIRGKYGFGNVTSEIKIPSYPDWDLAQWCVEGDIDAKGLYPNDYINTFISTNTSLANGVDDSIVAGSYDQGVNADGTTVGGAQPTRLKNFMNTQNAKDAAEGIINSRVNFHYISKRIKFNRPAWLADYTVDTTLINCLAQNNSGTNASETAVGSYFGCWVEKGFDEFTIYVAFSADTNNFVYTGSKFSKTPPGSPYPGPNSSVTTSGGKKKKKTVTVSVQEREGGKFSGFVVPVSDILYSNTSPVKEAFAQGYAGNPRIGKCTYPTVMWKITGVPQNAVSFLYGNLNTPQTSVVNLKSE